MKFINILGLIFQFAAFWFAAPELLGSDTMKRFEASMISFISKAPAFIIAVFSIILGIGLSIFGTTQGIKATESNSQDFIFIMLFIIIISILLMVYFIFFAKKTQQWMTINLAKPLIQKLISNNESRKTALIIGAVLFTLGFLLQLIVLIFN